MRQVVGDPQGLERALNRKGGLVALLQFTYPEASVTVSRGDRMGLPL